VSDSLKAGDMAGCLARRARAKRHLYARIEPL